jgi:hypothetical protein
LLISIIASVWHNHELLLQMCEVITGLTTHSKNRATWLKGEVRENLGDFRKSIQILTFLSPLPHVPLPFTKTNNDLKRMQLTSGIKYWTSNPVWVTFQEHGSFFYVNIEKKYDYWWKYGLEKTDRNWATSLKPRRRSRPLRLVWWALNHELFVFHIIYIYGSL